MSTSTASRGTREAGRPSQNGKHPTLANGERGSLVFVCVDLDLAEPMRKAVFHAACNVHDSGQLKAFVDQRAAVVAFLGADSRTNAEQAATWLETACTPERVGLLDLTDAFGFGG